ncbi:MAG: metal ABC transporter permease [Sheuella sp.]|nr:metal ABC transporter permease [Sheuella sp.]
MVSDWFVQLYGWLFQPFVDYGFMRRALVACLAIALACGPIGTILVLRRMSLAGDAIAHAVLPGAAVGFIFFGLSLPAMTIGSFAAAALMALIAAAVTQWTAQKEDASFASFYLITLALGVMLIATAGSKVDLLNFLFGSVLAIDDESLLLISGASSLTLLGLAIIWRPLIIECFDPIFLRSVGGRGGLIHQFFMLLVVLTLVSAFQALGTLMAVGLLMLPATAARFWCAGVVVRALLASAIGAFSGACGLLISYHVNVPSGPAIVLFAGFLYLLSLCLGARDSLRLIWFPAHQHKEA